jgi:hypothetical protein
MLLLNISPTYMGLLALLVGALATWRWLSQKRAYRETPSSPAPTIPPLPPLELPHKNWPPVAVPRGLEQTSADIPSIPEIPLSREDRKTAQEYLKKKG